MIDLLFTFGAVAESKTLRPHRRFDDSQDCLTFLKRRVAGFAGLRLGPSCPEHSGPPVPWRSL